MKKIETLNQQKNRRINKCKKIEERHTLLIYILIHLVWIENCTKVNVDFNKIIEAKREEKIFKKWLVKRPLEKGKFAVDPSIEAVAFLVWYNYKIQLWD